MGAKTHRRVFMIPSFSLPLTDPCHSPEVSMMISKLNKQVAGIALCATIGSAAIIFAGNAAAEPGMYVGGAYGQSRVDDSDFDDNNPAYKIFVGGKFNDYIGLELAGNDFGEAESGIYSSDLTGVTLALMVYLPLTDSFELFVKGGQLWWENDVKILNTYNDKLDGEELFYGVGMNFKFTDTLSLRVELERYKVELSQNEIGVGVDGSFNVDVASVGLLLNF